MLTEKQIAFESSCGSYWVKQVDSGYEVYKTGITHSVRCAIIGYRGEIGLERAKREIERRLTEK